VEWDELYRKVGCSRVSGGGINSDVYKVAGGDGTGGWNMEYWRRADEDKGIYTNTDG